VQGNNLSYPTIAVNRDGHGVMGMTLMGKDYYPSVAWAPLGEHGAGKVRVLVKGRGPDDGFGAYPPVAGTSSEITRWGDYGAATVTGSRIWIADEWIGQTCTFRQWLQTNATCGDTRSPFENWSTRITELRPTG
jgi:hypothetical protein